MDDILYQAMFESDLIGDEGNSMDAPATSFSQSESPSSSRDGGRSNPLGDILNSSATSTEESNPLHTLSSVVLADDAARSSSAVPSESPSTSNGVIRSANSISPSSRETPKTSPSLPSTSSHFESPDGPPVLKAVITRTTNGRPVGHVPPTARDTATAGGAIRRIVPSNSSPNLSRAGDIVEDPRRVILKRTTRGPNGPVTTVTPCWLIYNELGQKEYHSIPESAGGKSRLMTTVNPNGTPLRKVATPSSLPPALPSIRGRGGMTQIVSRGAPGGEPRRIVVYRGNGEDGGNAMQGGGGGGVIRRLSYSPYSPPVDQMNAFHPRGGYVQGGRIVRRHPGTYPSVVSDRLRGLPGSTGVPLSRVRHHMPDTPYSLPRDNNSYTTYTPRPVYNRPVRGTPLHRAHAMNGRGSAIRHPAVARPSPPQQQSVNTTFASMPQGIVGQDRGRRPAAGGGSVAAGETKRKNGPGAVGGTADPSSPAALPKMNRTAKEEMQKAISMAAARSLRNDIDEEEENLGHAETYADYKPAKLRSGLPHPDSVVETATLSGVSPPEVKYQINIPEEIIDTGAISALQLEAVIYACQMHENFMPTGERLGYLIGDGAGVGKGRTVAATIFENYQLGRRRQAYRGGRDNGDSFRALWLSVSNDLKYDAERDLRDIGAANIQVHALNKMKYCKINGKENGHIKKGVMFSTYSSLIGECRNAKKKYASRLKQLIQWLGIDFDGVIVFDECHRAKNLVPSTGAKPTKTGQMVLELQRALPKARVIYASATGASEPRNMAYMTRLGLWGPGQSFKDFGEFINAVERRGVGAMEIVAMDMKQRGLYLARQLSFRGVNFTVKEVRLTDDFIRAYDDSVKLWMEVRRQFQLVLSTMDEEDRLTCKHVWGHFWASHQRFFKYLCIAAKVSACVEIAREAIAKDQCVVIGLQSTGEARTLEAIDEMGGEITEFVSTAKAVLQSLIDKHFPQAGDSNFDIMKDFDRLFGDLDNPRRKRPARRRDVLEELGLGPSNGQPKKKKFKGGDDSDTNTSTTSSDESSDDEESDEEAASEEDGSEIEEMKLQGPEWLKALLEEAESSTEEEDQGSEDEAKPPVKREPNGNEGLDDFFIPRPVKTEVKAEEYDEYDDETHDDFNPFTFSYNDDPYAERQQVIEDSPKKKKRKRKDSDGESEEEKERLHQLEVARRKKLERRKRKRNEIREKFAKISEQKKQREISSDAVKKTAQDFMASSHLVDGDPDSINPTMMKAELLAAVERLGPSLPANTLDQLIDDLGGPEFVAEMTGRKGRIVQREDGAIDYELRHAAADVPIELMNMDEKDKFMKGEKFIAIISEAASSGISLQSDRRAPNKRRRVHITLELPWSADKAIQQFGRTHRSNQVSAPEYIFLISELAGEKRFASIVAKRLESLGALTHGDRRATESRDLSQFNFDTKYGRSALDVLLRSIVGQVPPLLPPPEDYKPGNFFSDMRVYLEGVGVLSVPTGVSPNSPTAVFTVERDASTIAKFLNRILGLPVHAQNALFAYFSDIMAELVQQAKHDGTYDMGIMDLGTGGDQVRRMESRVFLGRKEKGSFRVEINKIGVERGVSWDEAFSIHKEHNTGEDGFYLHAVSKTKKIAILVYGIGKKRIESGARLYAVTRPSTGRSAKLETMSELSKKYSKTTAEEAKSYWEDQYIGSAQLCQHAYAHGKCRSGDVGQYCETGRRTRTYFVLSGSVLSVWPVVEDVLSSGGKDRRASRMQVIRVRTESGNKIVGLLVLPHFVRQLIASLEEKCGRAVIESEGPPTA